MSGKVIPISSSAHFRKVTGSSSYTIVDFYATWCGPCKTISPIFEQLAAAESKPGRLTFCKVDVDDHQDISGQYGVSAMPTFLVLKGSTVKDTIQGANVSLPLSCIGSHRSLQMLAALCPTQRRARSLGRCRPWDRRYACHVHRQRTDPGHVRRRQSTSATRPAQPRPAPQLSCTVCTGSRDCRICDPVSWPILHYSDQP